MSFILVHHFSLPSDLHSTLVSTQIAEFIFHDGRSKKAKSVLPNLHQTGICLSGFLAACLLAQLLSPQFQPDD